MPHSDEDQAITVRPTKTSLHAAQRVFAERGIGMRGFVTACLAAVADDPDSFLRQLEEHWPPEKPRGRPPATTETDSGQPAHKPKPAAE